MKRSTSISLYPSSLLIFLLLVVLSLATGTVAAQNRPLCDSDSSVMGWDRQAASGATFTMTKDCRTTSSAYLEILNGKSFTIDGAGYTIYAADKSQYNDTGTVFGFESASNISLTLRNLTIEGGGDAASPSGGDPDPAILLKNGSLILAGVTIQNTRGGAIRVAGTGSITLKNARFLSNSVVAGDYGSAITATAGGSTITFQDELTLTNNMGGITAIFLSGGAIDMSALRCKNDSGNRNSVGQNSAFLVDTEIYDIVNPIWLALPSCAGNVGNTGARSDSGGGDDDKNGQCLLGTVGSHSVYCIARFDDGTVLLQIYRVDDHSVGHWVMNVSQAAIDAVSGPACVAASPDGRYAVRVWADGNITIYDGPDHESKVFHNTLQGGLSRTVLETLTTYSSTPPGVGCPGYAG